jgi:hypothetical protein
MSKIIMEASNSTSRLRAVSLSGPATISPAVNSLKLADQFLPDHLIQQEALKLILHERPKAIAHEELEKEVESLAAEPTRANMVEESKKQAQASTREAKELKNKAKALEMELIGAESEVQDSRKELEMAN